MQPTFEKVPLVGDQLYLLWVRAEPRFAFKWHYHPEYELTLITRGRGTRMVGDHVGDYTEGDLVLLGPHVPHTWSSAGEAGTRGGRAMNEARVLHISPHLFSPAFLAQPDLQSLAELLHQSRRGLIFRGRTREEAARLLQACPKARGMARLIRIFELFQVLANSREVRPLATTEAGGVENPWRSSAMERIYQYLHEHLADDLGLESVARHFNMTPSTLHRHLKKATGRSLTRLVNELRISQACSLLAHSDLRVAEICYRCGYQNLSYFNRRFLELKRLTPRNYRREVLGQPVPEQGMDP